MAESLDGAARKAEKEHAAFQRQLKANSAQLQADLDEASRSVSAFAQLNDINEQVWMCSLSMSAWSHDRTVALQWARRARQTGHDLRIVARVDQLWTSCIIPVWPQLLPSTMQALFVAPIH